jgi:hypothetical protein
MSSYSRRSGATSPASRRRCPRRPSRPGRARRRGRPGRCATSPSEGASGRNGPVGPPFPCRRVPSESRGGARAQPLQRWPTPEHVWWRASGRAQASAGWGSLSPSPRHASRFERCVGCGETHPRSRGRSRSLGAPRATLGATAGECSPTRPLSSPTLTRAARRVGAAEHPPRRCLGDVELALERPWTTASRIRETRSCARRRRCERGRRWASTGIASRTSTEPPKPSTCDR